LRTFFYLLAISIITGFAVTALLWPTLWACGVFQLPSIFRRKPRQTVAAETNVRHGYIYMLNISGTEIEALKALCEASRGEHSYASPMTAKTEARMQTQSDQETYATARI